ncbi:MAG: hypothetical protein ACOYXT_10365 [Bacteroidota bacterium]
MPKKKINTILTALYATILVAAVDSCANNDLEAPLNIDCTGVATVSFSLQVQPIINSKCAIPECHNGDNGADINWTVPEKLQAHAAEAKRRIQLPKTDADHMPREGELSFDQIETIVCWATQGAPINN